MKNQEEVVFYWDRRPGVFVNKTTGREVDLSTPLSPGPAFNGSIREWYETLTETLIDVRNNLTPEGKVRERTIVRAHPDVCCMLICSVLFRPSPHDTFSGTMGSSPLFEVVGDPKATRFEPTVEVRFANNTSAKGRVIILDGTNLATA